MSIKDAILHYSEKCINAGITSITQFPPRVDMSKISPELSARFGRGEFFIEKHEHTAFEAFTAEIGYPMPRELCEYFNAFYHPGIFGYIKGLDECIMLFDTVRYSGESPDDILTRENGIISRIKKWHFLYKGNARRFIPIGIYDAYSQLYVLYEIATGRIYTEITDDEGNDDEEAIIENGVIANSLTELIFKLEIKK